MHSVPQTIENEHIELFKTNVIIQARIIDLENNFRCVFVNNILYSKAFLLFFAAPIFKVFPKNENIIKRHMQCEVSLLLTDAIIHPNLSKTNTLLLKGTGTKSRDFTQQTSIVIHYL